MSKAAAILAVALVAIGIAGADAAAELLSSRPITIVIPFTPGASADTIQRIVTKKVTENTGQTIVVESRPGGGGAIGEGDYGIGRGGLDGKALAFWCFVGIPIAWGVWITLKNAIIIFQ